MGLVVPGSMLHRDRVRMLERCSGKKICIPKAVFQGFGVFRLRTAGGGWDSSIKQ